MTEPPFNLYVALLCVCREAAQGLLRFANALFGLLEFKLNFAFQLCQLRQLLC
jgi:hypothetical protein